MGGRVGYREGRNRERKRREMVRMWVVAREREKERV